MRRYYYSEPIGKFIQQSPTEILGELALGSPTVEQPQRDAWLEEISILKAVLEPYRETGKVYFEYSIPRLGKRIDVVALIKSVVFVLEFKVYEEVFTSYALDQVWDYALDLKNFHESSHNEYIAPILIATRAKLSDAASTTPAPASDKLFAPIKATPDSLPRVIADVLQVAAGPPIDAAQWELGRYCPTPTIVEAAMALYNRHSVAEISRSDAAATNLTHTSAAISEIIRNAREKSRKSICFVTGVPGAGKTLVGLNVATEHIDKGSELYSVYLSGNGPLVAILREALARDKVGRESERGNKVKKGTARSEVSMFIQNVHEFRDESLRDQKAPVEHVALFDEAQRAWDLEMTADFMRRKRHLHDFAHSEPEFLISCLDRHKDWAVIVCLVGGGQEINRGEAGITEWLDSLGRCFPTWNIHASSRLTDSEYGAGEILRRLKSQPNVTFDDSLHLAVSMRSFRAENVSLLVKELLDIEEASARGTWEQIRGRYPIAITRDLRRAKQWLRDHARGTERYGILASSEAQRLKPHAINVKYVIDPVHWFLKGKEDVRSSYYLEDVATEFQVQGLELDWACVTWDADFRYGNKGWEHWSFVGDRWNRINKPDRKIYLKNAYRVLLTRARQGMVIFVPEGEATDPTRSPEFYDSTFEYLRDLGFNTV